MCVGDMMASHGRSVKLRDYSDGFVTIDIMYYY